jgi:hypothetical protein
MIKELTQFARVSKGFDSSDKTGRVIIGFFPVISSRSTTPNEKVSDLSLISPMENSGARYLESSHEQSYL